MRQEETAYLISNYRELAAAIIQENRMDMRFRASRWCSILMDFLGINRLPELKPKKKNIRPRRRFDEGFKKKVAMEYDSSIVTVTALAEKHDVMKSTICRWLEQYSTRYGHEEEDFVF